MSLFKTSSRSILIYSSDMYNSYVPKVVNCFDIKTTHSPLQKVSRNAPLTSMDSRKKSDDFLLYHYYGYHFFALSHRLVKIQLCLQTRFLSLTSLKTIIKCLTYVFLNQKRVNALRCKHREHDIFTTIRISLDSFSHRGRHGNLIQVGCCNVLFSGC